VVTDLIARGIVGLVGNRAPDLSIDEVMFMLLREVRRLKATRVVIDSLSEFELALAPTFREDFRESLSSLVTALAHAGVTVLMTSELEDRYTDLRFSPYGTAFMTDAIIVQRYIEVDSRLRRVMALVKVRASAHSDELREFRIGADGIHIGAMLPDREGLLGGRPSTRHAADPRPLARVPTRLATVIYNGRTRDRGVVDSVVRRERTVHLLSCRPHNATGVSDLFA
jgi:circadian clock protein KaiC